MYGWGESMNHDPRLQRIREAYLKMARDALYRPQAPEDGFGNIQLTRAELSDLGRLEREATAFAIGFLRQEDELTFRIGCSDFRTSCALVFVIEAARQLCTGPAGILVAEKLLAMARAELWQAQDNINKRRAP
jgi:hypothetical protein